MPTRAAAALLVQKSIVGSDFFLQHASTKRSVRKTKKDLLPVDRVGEIRCPVLSIHGTDDVAISMDRAEALAAELSDHRGLVRVDGAAHAPNMTHPAIVNAALADFLASL